MRRLAPDEAALWARVMAQVRPLRAVVAVPAVQPGAPVASSVAAAPKPLGSAKVRVPPLVVSHRATGTDGVKPALRKAPVSPSNTLDGTWDRHLSRGLVSPDRTIDLHGHTLHSAYDLLDVALDTAIRHGDRVILLVTGKPPRPTSERPHAPNTFRGAIRAATGDWLAGSRHSSAIAAVRGAHPRHGGAGALYIVLKRPRQRA